MESNELSSVSVSISMFTSSAEVEVDQMKQLSLTSTVVKKQASELSATEESIIQHMSHSLSTKASAKDSAFEQVSQYSLTVSGSDEQDIEPPAYRYSAVGQLSNSLSINADGNDQATSQPSATKQSVMEQLLPHLLSKEETTKQSNQHVPTSGCPWNSSATNQDNTPQIAQFSSSDKGANGQSVLLPSSSGQAQNGHLVNLTDLPPEVLLCIFSLVSTSDLLCNVAYVCQQFYDITKNPGVHIVITMNPISQVIDKSYEDGAMRFLCQATLMKEFHFRRNCVFVPQESCFSSKPCFFKTYYCDKLISAIQNHCHLKVVDISHKYVSMSLDGFQKMILSR